MCARRCSAFARNMPLACFLGRKSCTAWDSTLRIPKPASGLPVRSHMRKFLSLLLVQCNGGCGKYTSLATDAVDDAIPMPLQMGTHLSLSGCEDRTSTTVWRAFYHMIDAIQPGISTILVLGRACNTLRSPVAVPSCSHQIC